MRVVLDTNVLIAAFATRGLCEDILRTVLAEHELVVSPFILGELERVVIEKLRMPGRKARAVTAFIGDAAEHADPDEAASWPERDPDDRWIVATAIAGRADLLVSGDRDLLEGAHAAPVEIVSPRGFWERLK